MVFMLAFYLEIYLRNEKGWRLNAGRGGSSEGGGRFKN
jgi:hypothetical protein